MSEEEKEAIKNMKIFARIHEDMTIVTAEDMDVVLHLVEKLQKENKELNILLKQQSKDIGYMVLNYIPKDKIKAKIQEIENGKENYTFYKLISKEIRRTIITNLKELLEE